MLIFEDLVEVKSGHYADRYSVYNINKTGSQRFKGGKVIGKLNDYPTENN